VKTGGKITPVFKRDPHCSGPNGKGILLISLNRKNIIPVAADPKTAQINDALKSA
jgi:hypothetical protein